MRYKILLILAMLFCSGCLVSNPDHFKLAGEFSLETSGILDYITGVKFRVFGGIVLERATHEKSSRQEEEFILPLDAIINDTIGQ